MTKIVKSVMIFLLVMLTVANNISIIVLAVEKSIDSQPTVNKASVSITWAYNSSTHALTLSGSGDMSDYSNFNVAPWLQHKDEIESIILSDSITSIGNYAFAQCRYVVSVTLPSNLKKIGNQAFYECNSLSTLIFSNKLESIGDYSFYDCYELSSVKLGTSVKSIGIYAFAQCTSLAEIYIPLSVTSIGNGAFNWCYDLVNVYYSSSQSQWNAISLGSNNACLTLATIHYNSKVCGTGSSGIYRRYGSFTVTPKQCDYNESFFVLPGVKALVGGTQIFADNDTKLITIDRDSLIGTAVLLKNTFQDYIIPDVVLKSFDRGINFDAYMRLDKNDGKPYISTVFGKNSTAYEYQDLFKTPMVAEIDNKYDIVVSAVGLIGNVTYYIKQDSTHYLTSLTGRFSAADVYSALDLYKSVYVYAKDSQGNSTDLEKISLSKSKDDGSLSKILNMSTYSLGGSGGLTIKIPDENPIFGNSEISLKAFSAPITVYYDTTSDTYIGTIGFDLYSYSKNDHTASLASTHSSLTRIGEGETKKAFQNFKESFGYFNKKPFATDEKDQSGKTYKEQWISFVNRCKTASKFSTKDRDKNFSVDFLGYLEFAVTEQGFVVKEAKLKIGTEFSYSYTYQGAIWVIPAYFKASLGASAALEGSGKRTIADRDVPFEYEISLSVEPSLALEAGFGVEKLVKAGVEAKGTVPIKVEFHKKHFKLDFHGEINIKAKAFIFSWDKKLCEGDLNVVDKYWGTSSKAKSATRNENNDVTALLSQYFDENTEILDRGYMVNTSEWLGKTGFLKRIMSNLSGASKVNIEQLQTSTFEDGKPVVVSFGDKALMAWVEDCSNRDTYNRMRLMYSVYDGNSWSTPAAVLDDGKNDDAPVLTTDGNNVYFAWQKINAVLNNSPAVTDALQQVDICTAMYDAEAGCIKNAKVIVNAGYDYAPSITITNGNPVVYFASCTDASVAISANSAINKYESDSVTKIADDLTYVHSIVADGANVSYVVDTDGDLSTSNDINVFTYTASGTSAFDKGDNNTAYASAYYGILNGEKTLFATDGTNIYYQSDNEMCTVFTKSQSLSGLKLLAVQDAPAFVWTEDNEYGNDVYYTYYDGEAWTQPVVIAQGDGYYFDSLDMTSFDGKLLGVFMQEELFKEDDTVKIAQTNLAYMTVEEYSDLRVCCVSADEEQLVEGQNAVVIVYAENNGTQKIGETEFKLTDSIGQEQTVTVDLDLLSGEGKNISLTYTVPNEFERTTLTVSGEITGETDIDDTNNSADLEIGVPDLRFDSCSYVVDGDYYVVTACVGNDSCSAARDITAELRLNDEENGYYMTATMDEVASDEVGKAQFYVEKDMLQFDENNMAKMYCKFICEDSKYGETVTKCLLITKESTTNASGFTVTPIPNQTYTGSPIKPTVEVEFNGKALVLNTDYTVTYTNNINAGTATVTITGIGNFTGTTTATFVIVRVPLEGIALNTETLSLQYKGMGKLTVTFNPTEATNKNVTWKSSNEKVATVDQNGNITAKGTGTATITATAEDGSHTASCTVTVKTVWWQWLIIIILFGWLWY